MSRKSYRIDQADPSGELYKCWKVCHTLATAQALVTKTKESGGFLRWYFCQQCNAHHTTSHTDRAPRRPYTRQPAGGRRHWSRRG
jgi:hypothetical protein